MAKRGEAEPSSALVPVVIRGETYTIRAEEPPEYIESLAEFVDSKLEEIAQATGTKDDRKLAILVALNLADEFFKIEKQQVADGENWSKTVGELVKELERSIKEPTETSPAAGVS